MKPIVPQYFNDKAHVIVQDVLDYAEERHVREGTCTAQSAAQYLTLDYIATCRDFMFHATQYLENEERVGADLFLAKLPRGRLKDRFERNRVACAWQLATQTRRYFPDYEPLLRLAFLHVLRSVDDTNTIRWNGVVLLAAASLPGVLTDIRRELRRRGIKYDVTLVADATVERRTERAARLPTLLCLR